VCVPIVQRLTDLVNRRPVIGHLARGHGLAHADFASRAMVGAEAIEQVFVPLVLLASAVTIELGE
jgi:hypothetical protein